MAQFAPGQSGNPAGKPPGPNKVTVALRKIVHAQAPKIIRKLCEDAAAGDRVAAALVIRFLPKSRVADGVIFDPSIVADARDVPKAIEETIAQVAAGELTPVEGQAIAGLYEALGRSITAATYEDRLQALESRLFNGGADDADVPIGDGATAH